MALKVMVVPVTAFEQNCSLMWDDETMEGVVVDPGGDLDRVEAAVAEQGVKLVKVLCTHAHIDHAGLLGEFAQKHALPIEGPHEGDQFWIDLLPEQGANYGMPGAQAFTPDRWLNDGDQVTFGTITLDVVHVPGHTPGHVVFVDAAHRIAIVGDVIFQYSIGRTDFPQGNAQQLIDGIRHKLFPLGDDITFVPGHGGTSTFGQERAMNPFVGDAVAGD